MKYFKEKINPQNKTELFKIGVSYLIKTIPEIKKEKKIIKELFKREKESSTNFGMDFAVPHCQSKYIKEPCLGFVSFDNNIDYEDDNPPISFAVFIFLPKKLATEQVKILSRLTRKLIDKKVQKLFKNLDSKTIKNFINNL